MKTLLKIFAFILIYSTAGHALAQTLISEYFDYAGPSGTSLDGLNGEVIGQPLGPRTMGLFWVVPI